MKICVRAHDLGKGTAAEVAEKAKAVGFDGVQLVLPKAIQGVTGEAGTLNDSLVQSIASEFHKRDIEIAMLGAYFNPVHSNKELVDRCVAKFREHLQYAVKFGSRFVGSETGSYNDDHWTYNPKNRLPEAFEEDKRIFGSLADTAEQYGSNIAVEGAWGHCMWEPKRLKELVNEIDNGHVFITVDIFNYMYMGNYTKPIEIYQECLKLFGDKIVIFHLKDFVIKDNDLSQICLGKGLMQLDTLLPMIKDNCPNAYLVFEGTELQDMKPAFDFVAQYVK